MASAVLKMPTPIRPAKHPKPMVCIDDVTMAFGDFVATENVNITVADGEFVSVVGPTGCGKSTILNAVAGLLKPAKGSVTIDGQPVSGIQGDIGYGPCLEGGPSSHKIGGLKPGLLRGLPWLEHARADAETGGAGGAPGGHAV